MPESGFTTITSGPEMRSAEQVKVIHLGSAHFRLSTGRTAPALRLLIVRIR
jgi:hypothetical protein